MRKTKNILKVLNDASSESVIRNAGSIPKTDEEKWWHSFLFAVTDFISRRRKSDWPAMARNMRKLDKLLISGGKKYLPKEDLEKAYDLMGKGNLTHADTGEFCNYMKKKYKW